MVPPFQRRPLEKTIVSIIQFWHMFILSDIRRIKMTKPLMTKLPEDMKIGKRYLVVTTAHQTKRYILGYICSNGGKPFYPEYPSVVCAIQVFLRNTKMALTWFKSELGPEPE
jgi:hypothetical protein